MAHRSGKPLAEETKTKISEKLKGRKLSDEHRAKISANTRGRKPWNYDPVKAKERNDAQRQRLIERIKKQKEKDEKEYLKERNDNYERDELYKEVCKALTSERDKIFDEFVEGK